MFQLCDEEIPDFDDSDIEYTTKSLSIIYPFSECAKIGRIFSVDCYLTEKFGAICEYCDEMWFHEFGFQYHVTSEWGLPPVNVTMEREVALEYIPDGARGLLVQVVQAACVRVLTYVRPAYVYRVTYTPRVPEKAQRKHALITHAAQLAGYEVVHEGTDTCERRFWLMAPMPPQLTAQGQT